MKDLQWKRAWSGKSFLFSSKTRLSVYRIARSNVIPTSFPGSLSPAGNEVDAIPGRLCSAGNRIPSGFDLDAQFLVPNLTQLFSYNVFWK